MTTQEVRDPFLASLAQDVPGFRLVKKQSGFVRRLGEATQVIGMSLVDYKPEFRVSLVVTIRLEEAQRILNAFTGSPPRYHSMTVTTATTLEYFLPGAEQYCVRNPDEVLAAGKELAPVLRERIVPFLEGHADAQSLDAVMNSDEGASFDRTNPPYRQMSSLTLARLAGNPRFGELVAAYEKEAATWHPQDRQKLSAIVEYLRSHPPPALRGD